MDEPYPKPKKLKNHNQNHVKNNKNFDFVMGFGMT